jgi:hypothetical protein
VRFVENRVLERYREDLIRPACIVVAVVAVDDVE